MPFPVRLVACPIALASALVIPTATAEHTVARVVSVSTVKDSLVGSWSWSYKDLQGVMHKHVLEVEGTGDKVAARERMDEESPVKITDLKVTGNKVSFSVLRGKRRSAYSGTMKGDIIEGQVAVSDESQSNEYGWEAKREATKK